MEVIIGIGFVVCCIAFLVFCELLFPEDNTSRHIAKTVQDIQDRKNDKYK